MPRLSLSLLGPFQVTLEGGPVTDFKSNKVRALLAYLAVEADRPHRREVLAGLLWPDWPDREALSNLRYALSDLRRAIGDRTVEPPFLLITRDSLQFNTASDYALDVTAFTQMVEVDEGHPTAIDQLKGAVALYQDSFLEGFSVGDSPPFEEWALFTREQIGRQMSSALHRLATIYEGRGAYEQAQSYARRQIELEPWDEVAHQRLMRALALGGQRSAALAQYEVCRRLLAEELGVEPGAETTRLYQQIRDGELSAPVPAPARPPTIAPEPPAFLAEEEALEVDRPLFVARERELAQLERYLELALAGQGRVAFVTGEAGSGKTSLIQEFTLRAQEAHTNLIVVSGNCNAYTGIGDPYLPFREILELLTGDVEAKWAAGAMTGDHARRLWRTLPAAAQALVDVGPELIDTFIPRGALLRRATTHSQGSCRADWLTRLDELVAHKLLQPALRSIPSRASGQDAAAFSGAPGPQQSDLFEQVTRVLQALAQRGPLLLVLDDLQWADLGSISLLFHLGRQLAGSRILIVGAYRPEEVALGRPASTLHAGGTPPLGGQGGQERHPLGSVVNEFQRDFGDITVNLGRAEGRDFVEALLDSEPNRLGISFRELLYRQTRGHPLFTVELLRGLQERGDLVQDAEGCWVEGATLDWERLPARVEAVIAERIGRLAQPFQAALRVASVEGETFTAEVVARVQAVDEREVVRHLSGELDRRHRLVRAQAIERLGSRRVSRYRFRNYLFQKYLYDSLDPVERSYLHEDVGNALEALYGDQTQEIAAVAVQLARHFQEAGIADKAIHYLHQAGERAVQLSAYQEGVAHLTRGLELLTTLPQSTQRAGQELAFQLSLGLAWQGAKGTPSSEMKNAYTRARELCQQMGKTAQLGQVLGELAKYYYVWAEHQMARELAEEALSLTQQAGDPLFEAVSRWGLGYILFGLGEYATAQAHLQQVIAFYEPQQHHSLVLICGADAGVSALAYDACCLWCLGYPDRAHKRSQEALALARKLDHPFSTADVLSYAGCLFNQLRRDAQALKQHAEELVQLSSEKVGVWSPQGTFYRGGALAMLGRVQEGMAQLRAGIAASQSLGVRCYLSGPLCSLAGAQARAGNAEGGLATLAEALALVEETDERHWEAELHRLKGELLLMQGDEAGVKVEVEVEAERQFWEAIEVARRQRAKSWELRATTSLARLWQEQGKTAEAHQILAEIYNWFTEGFDTPDLQEAKMLLDELT